MNLRLDAITEPINELEPWARQLGQIAAQGLELCPDFPRIAQRAEAWWAHECLDRPIFIGTTNPRPERPITRRLELLDQPEAWLAAKQADMLQIHGVGDALPHIRADFGPVLLGGMLGGAIEFGADTTWTHAFINDDWSNAPDWQLLDDNPWWRMLQQRAQRVAAEAKGRYLLCTPDLGGSADVLLNLRGSAALCMDVVECPQRITAAVNAIYPAWRKAFTRLYEIALGSGAGLIHWLGLWSSRPYMVPACDFNFMISPRQFEQLCLPDIARQAATAGRAVFHLDGPGAARHIDALLEVNAIHAIQFTPGAGTTSALRWVEMFRKVQRKGRSLLIICPAEEVLPLCAALRPEGLALIVEDAASPDALDALFATFAGH
ncbi:MAG TPA: hypothetical protein VGK81_05535 [Anaerolineae bacterium]